MKATTLIAAAALVCGTAAFAQQDNASTRGSTSATTDSAKPADDAERTKNALKNFGHKTRNAMHRAGEKVREVAHNDKHHDRDRHARADDRDLDRHARAERMDHDRGHDRHARADRYGHDHDRDTRAMGAPARDMRDAEAARRQRMDDAYTNYSKKNNG